jgi:uncharacterized OsmC-like protein
VQQLLCVWRKRLVKTDSGEGERRRQKQGEPLREIVMPGVTPIEHCQRLSHVEVEELERRKGPGPVEQTVDHSRRHEEQRPGIRLVEADTRENVSVKAKKSPYPHIAASLASCSCMVRGLFTSTKPVRVAQMSRLVGRKTEAKAARIRQTRSLESEINYHIY